MGTHWNDFKKELNLTPDENAIIELETQLILAVVEAREQKGLTQKQLSELCGVKQPIIARLESSTHSPQLNSILKILQPLGYKLAVVRILTARHPKNPTVWHNQDRLPDLTAPFGAVFHIQSTNAFAQMHYVN